MMEDYMDCLEWPATKAEPNSPFSVEENNWVLTNDDLDTENEYLASLPLSLIENGKINEDELEFDDILETLSNEAGCSPAPSVEYTDFGLNVKVEDQVVSPPFSPVSSGDSSPNHKLFRAQIASEILNDLDKLKPEPLANWFEEKVDLPIFEDFPQPHSDTVSNIDGFLPEFDIYGYKDKTYQVQNTYGFEAVQPSVNLTPPQSPPIKQAVPALYDPIYQTQWAVNYDLEPVNHTDIDDIISTAANSISWEGKTLTILPNDSLNDNINLIENHNISEQATLYDCELSSGSSSERISEHSYILPHNETSSPGSPGSSSSSVYGSSENDDDWALPSPRAGKNKSTRGRNSEDRKSRKKEQNKNAATRYRQKKKAEIKILSNIEKELLDKNHKLKTQYEDLCREYTYVKTLIRDLYKAKGYLK